MIDIEQRYQELCETPSDINEHLGTIKKYANFCDHCTEMGVRSAVSLYALLASNCSKVVAYDIVEAYRPPKFDKLTFICADVLTIEIEQTDLLTIDTFHTYGQLKRELYLHSPKVNKYIVCHDTATFGIHSEDGTSPGLQQAINEFLLENRQWRIDYSVTHNNGLAILKRTI